MNILGDRCVCSKQDLSRERGSFGPMVGHGLNSFVFYNFGEASKPGVFAVLYHTLPFVTVSYLLHAVYSGHKLDTREISID